MSFLLGIILCVVFIYILLFLWMDVPDHASANELTHGLEEIPYTKPKERRVPRIVWWYWHDVSKVPESIKIITDRWKEVFGQVWDIRMVHQKNLKDYIDEDQWQLSKRVRWHQHKSDLFRLALLERYGGCWIDASICWNDGTRLEKMKQCIEQEGLDAYGFYIDLYTSDQRFPVMENWCFMAPKHSRLIRAWKKEFQRAVEMGFASYHKDVLEAENINKQKISYGHYLTQHLALQAVLQRNVRQKQTSFRIRMERAEDGMFLIHDKVGFLNSPQIAHLATSERSLQLPYIKIRGGDRLFLSAKRLKRLYDTHPPDRALSMDSISDPLST